ncbi:MAG: DUF485 domain-containing protein [Micavibrio sp.]|nr:DUF485 domain-containing protein [Micavibrio sp.]
MTEEEAKRIRNLPEFKEMTAAKKAVNIPINLVIILAYFGFVLMIAYDPAALGVPAGDGVISIGIYAGLALLVLAFLLTAVYMHLADGKLAELHRKLLAKIG